ncbi:tetratricopeptide repeat protein [Bacillus sp. SJS]|uniref:tetratricopeptide repeat protein n=1 Tax=Bacillus sp. SJS TaxID=1423321 RepID=UPI0004DCC3B3|nr:hypothetical protein [Bacillus sp. SJS]KZZ85685.1 hypothetical protein AS29_003595 [Bacillus sp. SJS]
MIWIFAAGSLLGITASILLSKFYYVKKIEQNQYGLLILWILLSFSVPVLGFVYGWFLLLAYMRKQDDTFMEEYSSYIHNKVYNFESLRETLRQDRELLNMTSHSTENTWMMKNLLLHMSNENTVNQEKIIKKGLNHPDMEAVHYAATITNVLHDRLSNLIQQQKKEKVTDRPSSYRQLLDSYQDYLSSELLSSAIREKTEAEYEVFLREAAEAFPDDPKYTEALGLYLFEKNPDEGERIFEGLLEQNPNSANVMWGWLKISYTKERWERVFELADRLRNHPDLVSFPGNQQEIIRYLGGEQK